MSLCKRLLANSQTALQDNFIISQLLVIDKVSDMSKPLALSIKLWHVTGLWALDK